MEKSVPHALENDATHPSLADRVIVHVFDRVAAGDWPCGSRITEEQLAADLHVSRTPVREAIRRMAEIGLLVVRPRRGLEITPIEWQDLVEITQLRAELESFGLALAMDRLGEEDLAELDALQQACESLLPSGDRQAIFRQDGLLHLALAKKSGNSYLEEVLARLEIRVLLCRMLLCRSEERIHAGILSHRRLLTAIRAGDRESAEALLRQHVNLGLEECHHGGELQGRNSAVRDRVASHWQPLGSALDRFGRPLGEEDEMPGRIIIGNDHGGYDAKVQLVAHLEAKGIEVSDAGCDSIDIVRYPHYARTVAGAVARGEFERGILICSTGIGMSIAANKVKGIRAAVCTDSYMAKMTRQHNNSNVLCLGGKITGIFELLDILDIWLEEQYVGGRHEISLGLIREQEEEYGLRLPRAKSSPSR